MHSYKSIVFISTILCSLLMAQTPHDREIKKAAMPTQETQPFETAGRDQAGELESKTDASIVEGMSAEDQPALELGRRVLAIQQAIANPTAPESMTAVTELGHDQRHYVMVRGWLAYQLQADQSLLDVGPDGGNPNIKSRAAFLKKAIRAIDLE